VREVRTFREPAGPTAFRLASVVKRVVALRRSIRLRDVEIGAGPSAVRYLGDGESLSFLAALHGGEARLKKIKVVTCIAQWLPEARRQGLAYLELNRLFGPLVPSGGFQTFPWVRQVINLDGPVSEAKRRSIEATYGRKVRQNRFEFRIEHGRAVADEFYWRFYRPHIEGRFGESAHLRTVSEVRSAVRRGFVLQVLEGGEWLAAAACRLQRRRVIALAFGVREASEDALRRGALSAVYYFLLEWARDRALSRVDLLRSRPHAADGVFEHKRRFGAEAVPDLWPHTAIWVFPAESRPLPAVAGGLQVWSGTRFCTLAGLLGETPPPPGDA
jgi:hypothetical protein